MRWSCLLWWLLAERIPITCLAEKRKLPSTPSETIDGQELLQHLRQRNGKTADPVNDRSGVVANPVINVVSRKDEQEDMKTTATKKTGLVVIPGLGRADRLDTVLHNLRMLAAGGYLTKRTVKKSRQSQKHSRKESSNDLSPPSHSQQWDCVIYIYADRNDVKTAGSNCPSVLHFIHHTCLCVPSASISFLMPRSSNSRIATLLSLTFIPSR